MLINTKSVNFIDDLKICLHVRYDALIRDILKQDIGERQVAFEKKASESHKNELMILLDDMNQEMQYHDVSFDAGKATLDSTSMEFIKDVMNCMRRASNGQFQVHVTMIVRMLHFLDGVEKDLEKRGYLNRSML